MKKGDTRGLSTVIATLLIILLVIVAVAIVWGVVRTIITNNSGQISFGQFTIDLEILSVKQNPNVDVSIKVRRNSGEGNLKGIIFSILDDKGETHLFEKHNVSLNQLETKTFSIDYAGKIVSVSIYPIFETSSGKTSTGNLADIYYYSGGGEEGDVNPNCIANCAGKECGDNGCGRICEPGCSGSTPNCNVLGMCTSEPVGNPDCSCSANTCVGATCNDGAEGFCFGALQPDCTDVSGNEIWCGPSQNEECNLIPNVCGTCAEGICDQGICCPSGYHNYGGTCQPDCDPIANCLGKECGTNGCGGICGTCDLPPFGPTFNCNLSQLCEECTPVCTGRTCGPSINECGNPAIECGNCTALFDETYFCNMASYSCQVCTPDCSGGRDCGNALNDCGTCGDNAGNCMGLDSCISGICTPPETALNTGTVYSIWPINIGIFFDSDDLPKSGVNYAYYWVRFPRTGGATCLQINEFVTPVVPAVYNMSYIKFITSSSEIKAGDSYEIWETYNGCTS